MVTRRGIGGVAAALVAVWLGIGAAAPALGTLSPFAMSEADRRTVARVERYLNGITTMTARFRQISEVGLPKTGTFYLSRPGRMRLEYDPPIRDFIVADGWFVFFWDAELEQQSSTPIGSSLADVILRENFRLSGDITVTDVARRNGYLEITVIDSEEPGKGQFTLIFEERPLKLRRWRVVDAQGVTTRVLLTDARTEVRLDEEMFYFRDPSRQRGE